MNDFWGNFLIEIGLFTFLGVLYYFYQKRKITHYEENKTPLVMGFILQSCLMEKKEIEQSELDSLIEALDDYLHNKTTTPPIPLLRLYLNSSRCSPELKDVIDSGLKEIDNDDTKK
ncbi:MAG: hypothetical protein NDI69_15705 [Bacteriovoracaceae bacterium]|nr:hypothetical protein [Bacteriovoracaceae bacterium]